MKGIERLKDSLNRKLGLIGEYQKRGNLSEAEIKEKNHLIMQVWELEDTIKELEGKRDE